MFYSLAMCLLMIKSKIDIHGLIAPSKMISTPLKSGKTKVKVERNDWTKLPNCEIHLWDTSDLRPRWRWKMVKVLIGTTTWLDWLTSWNIFDVVDISLTIADVDFWPLRNVDLHWPVLTINFDYSWFFPKKNYFLLWFFGLYLFGINCLFYK